MPSHVILCGLGELGFRTLERLQAFGESVEVLDPAPDPTFVRQLEDWGIPLHRAQGASVRALRDAGVKTARALIAVTHDDMINLAVALAAREENPGIRLVIRLFNRRLADKVEREIPHCRVLDVAALVAPVFALASQYDDILHCLDIPGGRFLLREWRGKLPADAQILAVRRAPTAESGLGDLGEATFEATPYWEIVPRHTAPLVSNEVAIGLQPADSQRVNPRRRSRLAIARNWVSDLAQMAREASRLPFTRILLFIMVLGVASAQVFGRALHLQWHEALYFVVTVLTTTGFGDISLRHASPAVVLYGTGLMLIGAMLMAVLYAFLTDYLLSTRLAPLLGQRLRPLRDHVILCGFGTVGYRIAEQLQAMGHSIVAIEKKENTELAERARRIGVSVVVANDEHAALATLRVAQARCVMAVTDDDVQNMELAIDVQEQNPRARVVLRLFDPNLARLVERSFGIHLVRSPSAIAAPAFAVAALADDLLDAFELGQVLWCVGRVAIQPGDDLLGRNAAELVGEQILAISFKRGQDWISPIPAGTRLTAGDEVVVVTPRPSWIALQTHRALAEH